MSASGAYTLAMRFALPHNGAAQDLRYSLRQQMQTRFCALWARCLEPDLPSSNNAGEAIFDELWELYCEDWRCYHTPEPHCALSRSI